MRSSIFVYVIAAAGYDIGYAMGSSAPAPNRWWAAPAFQLVALAAAVGIGRRLLGAGNAVDGATAGRGVPGDPATTTAPRCACPTLSFEMAKAVGHPVVDVTMSPGSHYYPCPLAGYASALRRPDEGGGDR